jgi:hypothetical protein
MKKIHIVGLALVAVAAFFAVSVASASAAPEWLVGGNPVTVLTSVTTTGLLTLTDLKASFLGASSVDCEGTLVGSVGAGGEDEITEIIGSEGKKYTSANATLGATFIECKGVAGCEGNGLVWPIGLPWLTQLELSGTAIIDDTKANAGEMGYAIECSIFGVKEEDSCTQALFAPSFIENMATENDTLFLVAEENASHCSLSGENSGDAAGEGLIAPLTGILAVSGE